MASKNTKLYVVKKAEVNEQAEECIQHFQIDM